MGQRNILPKGYKLVNGNQTYTIMEFVGAGANSVVYRAFYYDTLMSNRKHIVLLKELYPFEASRKIYRDQEWNLIVDPKENKFFDYHKKSFLMGNAIHLMLLEEESEHIAENLDSFEANKTIYTVLTSKKGKILSEMMKSGAGFPSLADTLLFIENVLRSLKSFHSHGLLHLDISPDNIFMVSPEHDETVAVRMLLLDFNSAYSMNEKPGFENQYYLGKAGYMAPEVILHRRDEIGPWTDIYSVCVLWYEILTGERFPQDRELLNLDNLVSPDSPLLAREEEDSVRGVNEILKKGLQILPQNRYQGWEEMLQDVKKLYDAVTGVSQEPIFVNQSQKERQKPAKRKALIGSVIGTVVVCAGIGAICLGGGNSDRNHEE